MVTRLRQLLGTAWHDAGQAPDPRSLAESDVLVSMTASAIEDIPRGMEFLLSRNRLNVAISRGKWKAIMIRSHALTDYLPTTPTGMGQLGAFLRLTAG